MELFQERGYTRTTVQEIAARAGLTERTFFRYFADKREVLFSGAKELEKAIIHRIETAPRAERPLDVVVAAFEAAGMELQQRRDFAFVRARYALLTRHAELQERELIKLASLAAAATRAIRARGVPEPAASVAAEAGLAVFKIGFERWVRDGGAQGITAHMRAAARALRTVAAGSSASPRATKRITRPAHRS